MSSLGTFTVDAMPWPGVTIRISVSVDSVDTSEIKGNCQAEKDMAIDAWEFVRQRYEMDSVPFSRFTLGGDGAARENGGAIIPH